MLGKLLAMVICGAIASAIANHKGRNTAGWFFGGFLLQLIGIVIVAVLPNLKNQQAERERIEGENRRLREKLRQEQVKSESFRKHASKRLDLHDGHLGIETRNAVPALQSPEDDLLSIGANDPAMEAEGLTSVTAEAKAPVAVLPRPATVKRQWHYESDGKVIGPIPEAALLMKVQDGAVKGSTLVWTEGFDDWKQAQHVSTLRPYL